MREYLMRMLEAEVQAMVSFVWQEKFTVRPIDPDRLAERIDRLCAAAASIGFVIAVESE